MPSPSPSFGVCCGLVGSLTAATCFLWQCCSSNPPKPLNDIGVVLNQTKLSRVTWTRHARPCLVHACLFSDHCCSMLPCILNRVRGTCHLFKPLLALDSKQMFCVFHTVQQPKCCAWTATPSVPLLPVPRSSHGCAPATDPASLPLRRCFKCVVAFLPIASQHTLPPSNSAIGSL